MTASDAGIYEMISLENLNTKTGKSGDAELDSSVQLMTIDQVEEMFSISKMTIWRWSNRTDVNFPTPIRIAGRRFWYRHELVQFIAAQRRG